MKSVVFQKWALRSMHRSCVSFFIKPKTAEKRFLVLFNRLVSSIWHNGHEAGEFDRFGNPSLMFVAKLVSSACGNLKLGSDIPP